MVKANVTPKRTHHNHEVKRLLSLAMISMSAMLTQYRKNGPAREMVTAYPKILRTLGESKREAQIHAMKVGHQMPCIKYVLNLRADHEATYLMRTM